MSLVWHRHQGSILRYYDCWPDNNIAHYPIHTQACQGEVQVILLSVTLGSIYKVVSKKMVYMFHKFSSVCLIPCTIRYGWPQTLQNNWTQRHISTILNFPKHPIHFLSIPSFLHGLFIQHYWFSISTKLNSDEVRYDLIPVLQNLKVNQLKKVKLFIFSHLEFFIYMVSFCEKSMFKLSCRTGPTVINHCYYIFMIYLYHIVQ